MPLTKIPAVVITGGLGYVGQSLAAMLAEQGENVVIIDIRDIESQVSGLKIFHDTIASRGVWLEIAQTFDIKTIYHCAGLIVVSESVEQPARYFHENLTAPLEMLNHLQEIGPAPLVFSSSAAVYGDPQSVPIPEDAAKSPISPYGVSKWQFEEILGAYDAAYGQPWVALRYFNVAGTVGAVKEQHEPETHLLPRVALALAQGQAPVVFGTDYPTADGTAVRDYIHMQDLVSVHLQAATYLARGNVSRAFNVGSGRGHSVQEVIDGFSRVLGRRVDAVRQPRRAGDPPVLVADITAARDILRFDPALSQNVEGMIEDIWRAIKES
jgi:UDP-glucose 4-epimerase